ncbi:MAG: hypothetical protein ABWZ02_07290, partial [Nakamurella sp.]
GPSRRSASPGSIAERKQAANMGWVLLQPSRQVRVDAVAVSGRVALSTDVVVPSAAALTLDLFVA